MKFHTLLLLIFTTFSAFAQKAVTISVKDSQTGDALPYATVYAGGHNFITDVDGNITLHNPSAIVSASYTGYDGGEVTITTGVLNYKIFLKPHTETLQEVTISNLSPGAEIMGRAIRRKPINDPQLNSQALVINLRKACGYRQP